MAGQITWYLSTSERSQYSNLSVQGSWPLVGTAEQNFNTNLAANSNTSLNAAFGVAGTNSGNLVAIGIVATQNATLRTNNANANAAQDTINLLANIPLVWNSQMNLNTPFNGAVTAFYVTCTSALNFKANILTY